MQLAFLREREDLQVESEQDLVELARLGGENAIRTLIERNNQRLFRVARFMLHNDIEAEDVVQEAYVKAFIKIDTFRGNSRFSTWLTRIAINEAIGRTRRTRLTVDLAAYGDGSSLTKPPVSLSPPASDSELIRRDVRTVLERVIDELPAAFRVVLVLRDLEGMSVEETADVLALKAATVETRLHRAHRMVRAASGRELPAAFFDIFPFDGARCAEIADRVIWDLRWLFARGRQNLGEDLISAMNE
jgi:RNA polymerase sigma-70 factor (ECF subfamily)